ncbi:MAG: transporter substrate-binding domain-containing protein [Colwellia sp.]|nr:transporter substrate-binding domain-containing protein [Colwellia sp.]
MYTANWLKFVLLLQLSFISLQIQAESNSTKVEIISGLPKPPFIMPVNVIEPIEGPVPDDKVQALYQGIQIDIMREALLSQNYLAEFTHVPLARNITNFQKWHVDGVSILPLHFAYPGMFISQPYVSYQNVVVSLKNRNYIIDDLDDLSGKSIAAFQKAKLFLGPEYEDIVKYSLGYRELADQNKQIELLFNGSVEVIILDINIFNYFLKTHQSRRHKVATTAHYIFKERVYSAGFKSEVIRDAFNIGLNALKASGQYQLIIDHYLK